MDDLSSVKFVPECAPPPRVLDVDLEATQCFLCGREAGEDNAVLEKCPKCNLVWYCCRDHLEIHRPENKCFPFVIKSSEAQGRYE